MESRFSEVKVGADLEIFSLIKAHAQDPFEKKVNLAPGVYRTAEGKPWVLPVVKATEEIMVKDPDHEYLLVMGNPKFTAASMTLLLGNDSNTLQEGRAFGIQALGGGGALRVAAEFLSRQLGHTVVYFSQPTWGNHKFIFSRAGFTDIRDYRYWDNKSRGLDFDGLIEDLRQAPENAVIVLHACAHNPTGCDPTKEQWKQIAAVMKERKLFPLFDSAYQGFATGDPEADAWAVRYFVEQRFELLCAQSYSKNFCLYGERVGNLAFVINDPQVTPGVQSQVQWNIRSIYSNPPRHGARIVATILNDPKSYSLWRESITVMSNRIKEMRKALRTRLEELEPNMSWEYITRHIGMFSYTGLNPQQCQYLIDEYHIYLLNSGRINMCGLNDGNIDYVAKALIDALKKFQS